LGVFTLPWWLMALLLVLGFWGIGAHNRLKALRRGVLGTFGALAGALAARRAAVIEGVHAEPPAVAPGVDEADAPAPACLHRAQTTEALRHAAQQAAAAQAAAIARPLAPGRLGSLSMAEEVFEQALAAWLCASGGEAAGQPARWAAADLDLAIARQAFNLAIESHNRALRQPPASLLAALLGFRELAPMSAGPGLVAAPPAAETPARLASDSVRAA
jgi:LemA protein